MANQGITFDKCMLTSRQHAHFQRLFLNGTDGITKGCAVSTLNNSVFVQKGFFVISGRFVEVTGVEEIQTPNVISGSLYCRTVYEIDLSKTNTESNFVQGTFKTLSSEAAYPELTQNDLDDTGTIYQMPFCQYVKTASGISSFLDSRPIFNLQSVWATVSDNNEVYKNEFDSYFAAQKVTVEQMITDLQDEGYASQSDFNTLKNEVQNAIAVLIPSSKWSNSYPYSATILVPELSETDTPTLASALSGTETESQVKAYKKAIGLIFHATTADGSATFYATKKPEIDFSVFLKGVSSDV